MQSIVLALFLLIPISAAPGDLDTTFGSGGKVLATVPEAGAANDIAMQPDGKIVIASTSIGSDGRSDFLVIRLRQDGSVDTSFGVGGKVAIPFDEFSNETTAAIAVQSDGKILIGGSVELGAPGWDFGVARLNSDGSLDDTFGNSGKLKIAVSGGDDFASDLLIQPDGKIIVIGKSRPTPNWDVAVIRMAPDGSLDSTFNGSGKRVFSIGGNDFASEALVTADGRIVMVGGNGSDFAVLRLNPNGSFDATFAGTGIVTTPIGTQIDEAHVLTLQPDGKILAGGWGNSGSFNSATLVRYNADGSLDASFDNDGIVSVAAGPNATAIFNSIIVLPDGKILAAGSRRDAIFTGDFILTRYLTNGALDAGFGTAGVVRTTFGVDGSSLYCAVAESDNKVVAAGFGRLGFNYSFAAARYLMNETPAPEAKFDYDGDGRTDFSVFRPSSGAWYLERSTAGFQGLQFGAAGDKLSPADYDGDGKTDISIYRPSTGIWYILNSATSTVTYPVFGAAEDLPAPGDYDGDGKADLTVFRPSQGTWYRQNSSNGTFFGLQFGTTGDVPTVGDFDGDGKNDIGIFRPSIGDWYHLRSSDGSIFGERFGQTGDRIAPADYDGDGKTDIAIFRPSTGLWVVRNSATSTYSYAVFGSVNDVPISGDYDGDGKADIGVWRPANGTWYIQRSSNESFIVFPWGQNGDVPTPAAFGN